VSIEEVHEEEAEEAAAWDAVFPRSQVERDAERTGSMAPTFTRATDL